MRLLFALLLAAPLLSHGQGPYTVLLSTGDTLKGTSYYTRGDTFGLPGVAKVHRRDVVLFWTPKERWTFTHPEGKQERFKKQLTDSCARATLARLRNSDRLTPFDSLPIPSTWRSDTLMRRCYETWLMEQPVLFDDDEGEVVSEAYRALKQVSLDGSGGVAIGAPSQIIFLSGDTLSLKKEFHHKEGELCWYGGGCISVDTILLLRTVKGQFYYNAVGRRRFQLRQGVPDLSVGSLARIHANRFFSTRLSWEECPIPDALKSDTLFLQLYRAEVMRKMEYAERLRKRANNMRITSDALSGFHAAGTLGAAVGGSVGGARALPPEAMPYYGTPMPPE